MLTALQAADYLIARSTTEGDPVSDEKLQCLLYYAQSWYLALYDEKLFLDTIEIWRDGPGLPAVHEAFEKLALRPALEQRQRYHLDAVMQKYGARTEVQLQRLIRAEVPWILAKDGPSFDEHVMKYFYRYRPDVFVQSVELLCRLTVRLRIYQAGVAFARRLRTFLIALGIFWLQQVSF